MGAAMPVRAVEADFIRICGRNTERERSDRLLSDGDEIREQAFEFNCSGSHTVFCCFDLLRQRLYQSIVKGGMCTTLKQLSPHSLENPDHPGSTFWKQLKNRSIALKTDTRISTWNFKKIDPV